MATEPESRPSFRTVGATSSLRPAVIRFLAHLVRYKAGKGPYRSRPRVDLVPARLAGVPSETRTGEPILWECPTPIGPVPLELLELYPVGCYLGIEEFESRVDREESPVELDGLDVDASADSVPAWTARHTLAILEWVHGREAAEAIVGAGAVGGRSARTGRLRVLDRAGQRMFTVGNDGVPRPTWLGGELLHELRPFPAMRIIADPDASPFVAEGGSLFSKFVRGGDSSLVPGSSALVVDGDDHLLGVGRLVLAPPEMGRIARAVAVRVVAHARHPEGEPAPEEPNAVGERRDADREI